MNAFSSHFSMSLSLSLGMMETSMPEVLVDDG